MTRPPILRWAATIAAAVAALAAAPSALGAPQISGADGDAWNASRVPVRYSVTPSEPGTQITWILTRNLNEEVDKGKGPQITLPHLADGAYQLFVSDDTGFAARFFSVDTIAPAVVVRTPVEGASYRAGEAVAADFSCEGALVCVGTQPAGQPLATAVAGDHALEVTAVDEAGNVTIVRRGYRVLAPAPEAPPAPPAAPAAAGAGAGPQAFPRVPARAQAPETTNARLLRPGRGALLASTRPVLRWPARPGARFYNVQVFRLAGARYVKVLSAFPRRNRLRVPARRLKPGARHVWRVWPMVGRSFTPEPLGISYFEVRATAR